MAWGKKRLTIDEFIARSQRKHGRGAFDYHLVTYKNYRTHVKLRCTTCQNIFSVTPDQHLKGSGCPHCAGNQRSSTEAFIAKAQRKNPFASRYDYSRVNYVNAWTKVLIICKAHHVSFSQSPASHLQGKTGCKNCAASKQINARSRRRRNR